MVSQDSFTFDEDQEGGGSKKTKTSGESQRSRFNDLLDIIIDQINSVDDKWEMPWHKISSKPRNAYSGDFYSGFNILLLMTSLSKNQYTRNEWATLRQWNMLGTHVVRGEKGTPILYPITRKSAVDKNSSLDHYRVIAVFNVDQVAGKSNKQMNLFENQVSDIPDLMDFVNRVGATILSGAEAAYYTMANDEIHMPDKKMFFSTDTSTVDETYYSTLLHELIHWTGNERRCNREFGKEFGDEAYAFEELVAELGAAFLCVELEVSNSPRQDHSKYLKGWLSVLKNNKYDLVKAAGYANRAIGYLNKKAARE